MMLKKIVTLLRDSLNGKVNVETGKIGKIGLSGVSRGKEESNKIEVGLNSSVNPVNMTIGSTTININSTGTTKNNDISGSDVSNIKKYSK